MTITKPVSDTHQSLAHRAYGYRSRVPVADHGLVLTVTDPTKIKLGFTRTTRSHEQSPPLPGAIMPMEDSTVEGHIAQHFRRHLTTIASIDQSS